MNQKQQFLLDYLKKHPAGVKEYDLIHYLQEKNPFSKGLDNDKSLFKKHFYLFHQLYGLADEIKGLGFQLEINTLCIKLIDLASLGTNENNNLDQYNGEIVELKTFYLDKDNLDLPENEIERMLSLFWKKYLALESKAEAILCLGLQDQSNLTLNQIKKRYNQLASEHHPDKGGDSDQFMKIKTAYEQLKDLY